MIIIMLPLICVGGTVWKCVGGSCSGNFRPQFSVSASGAAITERTQLMCDLLGIQTCTTSPEIRSAYRSLVRVLYPDVTSGCSCGQFIRFLESYATRSDPQKRADYDQ